MKTGDTDDRLTVPILILSLAYAGQARSITMGCAGQLSLGHPLYVGLGACAAALFFRFGGSGVYFTALTMAFAAFARIGFDGRSRGDGSAGLFVPVASSAASNPAVIQSYLGDEAV